MWQEDLPAFLERLSGAVVSHRSALPINDIAAVLNVDMFAALIEDTEVRVRLGPDGHFAVAVELRFPNGNTLESAFELASSSQLFPEGEEAEAAARALCVRLRCLLFKTFAGQSCFTPAILDERWTALSEGLDPDLHRFVRWSILSAATSAASMLRKSPLLATLAGGAAPHRHGRYQLPIPVLSLNAHQSIFALPCTRRCRSFSAALQLHTKFIASVCSRTLIREDLHEDGSYPPFETSPEEEFHAISTLLVALAEVGTPTGHEIGVRYEPPALAGGSATAKQATSFVMEPPPPTNFSAFHLLCGSSALVREGLASPPPQPAEGIPPSTFVKRTVTTRQCWVRCLTSVESVQDALREIILPSPSEGVVFVIVLRPTRATWAELWAACRAVTDSQTALLCLDLTDCLELKQKGNGCHYSSQLLFPSLSVALGASYVLLPPPRGGHSVHLHNEFVRLEEEVVAKQGCAFLMPRSLKR